MDELQMTLNRLEVEKLHTQEGQDKLAQLGGQYIRDKVRETAFCDQIIPPTPVSETELIAGTTEGSSTAVPGFGADGQGDTVHVNRDVQIGGSAMIINFRTQPRAEFFNGKRFELPFGVVSTPIYEKTEEELLASKYNIAKVLEDTAFLETHTQRDKKFLSYADLAVAATGQALTRTGPIQRGTFRDAKIPILRNQIRPTRVLLSAIAFEDLGLMDSIDAGQGVMEITANGYTQAKIGNMTYIISIKSELFDTLSGNDLVSTKMYTWPDHEYLGYSHFLNQYKVWNNWERNIFRFSGWQTIGMAFGNIQGITRITVNYS